MHRRRAVPVILLAALAAAVLAGCGGGGGASPTASPSASASSSPSESASESPSPEPETVTLPTDCNALGTDATRAAVVGDLTLQSDGAGFVRPVPTGATLALGCDWIVGDATGVLLLISTAEPAAVTTAAEALPGEGFSCTVGDAETTVCTKTTPGTPVESVETVVAKHGVWIYSQTSNRDAMPLLIEIGDAIFA